MTAEPGLRPGQAEQAGERERRRSSAAGGEACDGGGPGRQVSARRGRAGARRKPSQRRASGRVAEFGGSAGRAE
ncbi:hypothetical protein FRY98_27315 [Paenibacillus faecis]|uniref:Uncharacterized protein n=1 Tax=Paenibacillus faecis TaxID=862114 RepID=A0A5D0CKF2_9BACL|nr:hypothetical protein [Paenibacillus faecis]TYA10291.1 hypothetical protein FRY98_27315 [Paenibacillus faecis]